MMEMRVQMPKGFCLRRKWEKSKEDDDPRGKKQRSMEEEGKCKAENSKEISNGEVAKPRRPLRIAGYFGYLSMVYDYYHSSFKPIIPPIRKDELFYFSQLALWSYNLKQVTDFDNVQVVKAKRCMAMDFFYYITFKAFSPQGVATTFQTKIRYNFPKPCTKIDIFFVRIADEDSDFSSEDFTQDSEEEKPSIHPHKDNKIYKRRLDQLFETQTNDSQFKLLVYLSQFALNDYNILDLHAASARHYIPSLKIVKPVEHVRKRTTYLITFEASLCDESKKVETFETKIRIPRLYPTTTIEFWNFKIKTN